MREPRRFQSGEDLTAMLDLLIAGRKADNGSYYVHCGDLQWWLYYPPLEGDHWNDIYLWDNPDHNRMLLGWALISADWVGYDVYVQPELRGTPEAVEMYAWAEHKAIQVARDKGRETIYVLWVRHDDQVLAERFRARGYRLGNGMVHLARKLDKSIDILRPSTEFIVRSCHGMSEVKERASCQYGAFASRAPFELYLKRFENFMASPVYDNRQDIVAATTAGQIGAFCVIWMDPVNRVGLFEPVGTHPDFQRKGLGKAVMFEGIRRMQECGMQQAIVSTYEDNDNAIKFYESMGFQTIFKLGTYEKDV